MLAMYAPVIYTAPCIMFLMRADMYVYITRAGGRGLWALEIESFLGPVKWHRADRRVPFGMGPKKLLIFDSFREKEKRKDRT